MRIPASKVYRAFPELDKFSDAQCESFVKAAARRSGRRALRLILQVLAAGIVFFGIGAVFVVIGDRWQASDEVLWRRNDFFMTWAAITMLATFVCTGMAFLVAKDILLRRAITRVMQERGTCTSCGYGLTGLPVNEHGGVLCPECGTTFTADASFGEIVSDESGERRFMPSPDAAPHVKYWMTPQQRRRLLWWGLGGPVGLVLLVALTWLGYELFLWRQSVTARADRLAPAQADRFVEDSQKGAASKDANGWAVLSAALSEMNRLDQVERSEAGDAAPSGGRWSVEFELVYGEAPPGQVLTPEEARRNREFARRLLEVWRRAGVLSALDEISRYPFALRPATLTQGLPLQFDLYQDWWDKRRLSTIFAARMKLATDAGDDAEFLAAFETNLALARMVASQISLWDRLSSGQVDALTLEGLQRHAREHPGGVWARKAIQALEHQTISVPAGRAFEGERLLARDVLAYIFSEKSNVRFGMWSLQNGFMGGGPPVASQRLGTYWQNRAEVEARIGHYEKASEHDPFERVAPPNWVPSVYIMTDQVTSLLPGSLASIDRQSAHRRGMLLLVALEAYRSDHSGYPRSLEDLSPSYLTVLPVDPWTGKPFRYVLAPDGGDYTLYAIGENLIDDGGLPEPSLPVQPWGLSGAPMNQGDVVIHTPKDGRTR